MNEESVHCPNGHDNEQGRKFCGECGASLTAPVSSSQRRTSAKIAWLVAAAAIVFAGVALLFAVNQADPQDVTSSQPTVDSPASEPMAPTLDATDEPTPLPDQANADTSAGLPSQPLEVPGEYEFPNEITITYGTPVAYKSDSQWLYKEDVGKGATYFQIPVEVENDSNQLVDGTYFTHVQDAEAGAQCESIDTDVEDIARVQPGAVASGAMAVACPKGTEGQVFTISAEFDLSYAGITVKGAPEGSFFLTGTVPS